MKMTRLRRWIGLMAAVLCIAAFCMPLTAFAASDTEPPAISAKLNGDTLHIEATDNTGVDAVFIGGKRVNYRVDSALDLTFKDYAGTNKTVSVYAVDFAGNKSKTVEIKNPYYVAPTSQPTPKPTQTQQPTPTPEPTPSSAPEPTGESSIPPEPQPFTPDGTGTVVDDVLQNQKEFFTITTPDGNVFYLIIDRDRDENGVYLLNAVTESDLASLAKKGDGKTESAIPDPKPAEQTPQPTTTPEPEKPAETPKENGSGGTILLVILAIAAIGGAGWYFKIYKPKQQAAMPDDTDEDEPDFEDYPEESEDYPGEEDGYDTSAKESDTGDSDYEDEK